MDQDTRVSTQSHNLIKAQEAQVLNSAFLIFEKIRNKMAHVFALCLQISIHVMVVAVEGK